MNEDHEIIKNEQETAETKFVSFKGEHQRYDLAIISTERFAGQKIVLDLQGNRFDIIDKESLETTGNLEHAFHLNEMETEEIKTYLRGLF